MRGRERRYGLTLDMMRRYLTLAQQLNLPRGLALDRDLAAAAAMADVELVITGPAG